jgi:hypothetical protein
VLPFQGTSLNDPFFRATIGSKPGEYFGSVLTRARKYLKGMKMPGRDVRALVKTLLQIDPGKRQSIEWVMSLPFIRDAPETPTKRIREEIVEVLKTQPI